MYKFNCVKTKSITLNSKNNILPQLLLNNKWLDQSSKEVHLSIYRNSVGSNTDTVQERIKSAWRAAYSLMGAGMHGLNGVGPQIGARQYCVYIIPILLYGPEVLVLKPTEMTMLEIFHRKCIRYIQHLPMSTATSAVHLLIGVPPIQAILDIQALKLFRNIVAADSNAPPAVYMKNLIMRQLAMENLESPSWVFHVRNLLQKYSLPILLLVSHYHHLAKLHGGIQ